MIVYHGTTKRRALGIVQSGFLPKKPSKRVWFAESRKYALGRAKTQARRARDRPVVLTCDIDVGELRRRYGPKRVFHRGRIVAINGAVPVSVLRSHPGAVDQPSSPDELAAWVNDVLRLKPHRGVGARHPGIQRLSRWVVNRVASQPKATIAPAVLLSMARQWLAEFFDGVEIDPDTLHALKHTPTIALEVEDKGYEPDPREDEAVELLDSPKARQRARGIGLLAKMNAADLFDWCAMFFDDESVHVRVAALKAMRDCVEAEAEVIEPYAASENKSVRAVAIAAMVVHADDAAQWLERGLRDPCPCVRVEAARLLDRFEPDAHRGAFELALHDRHPDVARTARKLTEHKGFAAAKW